MNTTFTALDWLVLALYIGALAAAGWLTTRRQQRAEDYFLDGHHAPTWLVAISLLSTVQSAATFLGVPDSSYRGSYVYLGGVLASLLAAWIVGRVLVPRFYALKVTTVYELLELRYDARARKAAAAMFLVGRVFASGSRLYLAAIAVAMILFLDITPQHLLIATLLLLVLGLAFTLMGGLHSVIWSDLVQVVLYVGAALIAAWLLWSHLPLSTAEAISRLVHAPGGNKLALADVSFNLTSPWSLPAVLIGVTLLNTASSGLDQDTTQRLLACRDARQGTRALYRFVAISLPVIALFLLIGSLLWLTYQGNAGATFRGEKVTVFMHWILTEMPAGLRGLAVVGVLAAAAMNSELIAMAAVIVGDFYRPWAEKRVARRGARSEAHFVRAGRIASVVVGLALSAMAMLSYYWQHYADAALLDFVLGVMAFAYSGLLGVYANALFTRRGNSASVIAALAAGFVTVLVFQPWIVDTLGLPAAWRAVAFPWQLTLGAIVAAAVCALGKPRPVS